MPDSANLESRSSRVSFVSRHPYLTAFLGGAIVAAGVFSASLMLLSSGDEEAPIRVKNGSLDFEILDPSQRWDSAGNWHIRNGTRYRNDFDVTVAAKAGASCPGSLSAVGATVRFTYNNNGTPAVVVLQSPANRTLVLPQGISLQNDPNGSTPTVLTFPGTGENSYLSKVEVGANLGQLQEICSFTAKNQLDSVLILNTK